MTKATIKLNSTGDDCSIITRCGQSCIIHLADHLSALDVYNQLFSEHAAGHLRNVQINVDDHFYDLQYETWQAVLSCLDQWFEDYAATIPAYK